MRRPGRIGLILAVVVLALFTACGGESEETPPTTAPTFVPWRSANVPIDLDNAPRIEIISQVGIHNATVSVLRFSSDSRYLATVSSADRRVNVWELETGMALVESGNAVALNVLFSNDSEFLYIVDQQQQVSQWSLADGQLQNTLELELDRAGPVVTTPDNRLVAIGGRRGNVSLLRLDPFQQLATIAAHPIVPVNVVRLSDDGRLLVTMGSADDITVWDTDTQERLAVIEGFPDDVQQVALSSDGRLVAASFVELIRIFDTTSQEQVTVLDIPTDSASTFMEFSDDGELLYFFGEGNAVELWEIASGERLVQLGQHSQRVTHAILGPDENLMLTATDRNVYLWDLNPVGRVSAAEINILRGAIPLPANLRVNTVEWSPDRSTIAVSDDFGEVFLFGIPSGPPAQGIPNTPDGSGEDN